jgi:hypothetical protein
VRRALFIDIVGDCFIHTGGVSGSGILVSL